MSLYKNYFGISEDTALPAVEQRGPCPQCGHPANTHHGGLNGRLCTEIKSTNSMCCCELPVPPDDKDAIIRRGRFISGEQAEYQDAELGPFIEASEYLALEAQLSAANETIRQMTELLREYRNGDYHHKCQVDEWYQRCSLCIKTDLLLKETK